MNRVVVLVNKDFEYAGFIEGLRDTVEVHSGTNGRDAECRFSNLIADIYCIHDLFEKGSNSSNSESKFNRLKNLFKSNVFRLEECDGILSFSTSESTPYSQGCLGVDSKNGCVYVGNKFFLSDQRENDATTESWLDIGDDESKHTELYLEKPISEKMYNFLSIIDMNLKHAPINSADKLFCRASDEFACVGVVNVMNYQCYKKADECAYDKFREMYNATVDKPIGIETTHGVVVKALRETCSEMSLEKSIHVNFISPIVDRYLKFDEDVDEKYGKQNFVCSYNGGVATGHILKVLNETGVNK